MRLVKRINEAFLTVDLRKDFYETLEGPLRELIIHTNADYFAHHFIQNYYKPGFYVSSFVSHDVWQDLYWNEYWYKDPLERKVYKNALENGSSIVPWNLSDSDSECMKELKRICCLKDGVMMAHRHDHFLESFSIGWENSQDHKNIKDILELKEKSFQIIRNMHFEIFKNRQ